MCNCKESSMSCYSIEVTERNLILKPGDRILLDRFSTIKWILKFGWYVYAGNRPVLGYYMCEVDNENNIRPLQKPDLTDIILVER